MPQTLRKLEEMSSNTPDSSPWPRLFGQQHRDLDCRVPRMPLRPNRLARWAKGTDCSTFRMWLRYLHRRIGPVEYIEVRALGHLSSPGATFPRVSTPKIAVCRRRGMVVAALRAVAMECGREIPDCSTSLRRLRCESPLCA